MSRYILCPIHNVTYDIYKGCIKCERDSLQKQLTEAKAENKRLTLIADVLDSHQVACRRKDCSVCYHYRQALKEVE